MSTEPTPAKKKIIIHSPKLKRVSQTEKLRERIANNFACAIGGTTRFKAMDRRGICLEFADQILQACKEAGLVFLIPCGHPGNPPEIKGIDLKFIQRGGKND